MLAAPTPPCLSKGNSAKVQEDLEAEFLSLFSVLEELKEGMLMKIKQDRASRTYELQVCMRGSRPDAAPHGAPQTPRSPAGLGIFLQTSSSSLPFSGDAPKCLQCPEPDASTV